MIFAPISTGELIDKITILEIKCLKFSGKQFNNCKNELESLQNILKENKIIINKNLIDHLRKVNNKLWDIEDQIREKEKLNFFDESFINLARSVYKENDKRSKIKRNINLETNSELIEEKSYKDY
tara:strand:+ start:6137 stop:6511 length:375 start_codon:yes stop_codon:yes gene_type:complete